MSGRVSKVHFDYGGRARCGNRAARQFTADREQVTCHYCANLLDGTHHVGVYHCDVEPCGTPAAYRRHLRHEGAPVRCETCLQAERRRSADGAQRAARRDRYREAREAGATVAEASRKQDLRRAA